MVDARTIQDFADAIARKFEPERIILFGSYAWGNPGKNSDVDLLVVAPHDEPAPKMASRIATSVAHDFPLDIIVRSPEELAARLAMEDWFFREIVEHGRVIYEAQHA